MRSLGLPAAFGGAGRAGKTKRKKKNKQPEPGDADAGEPDAGERWAGASEAEVLAAVMRDLREQPQPQPQAGRKKRRKRNRKQSGRAGDEDGAEGNEDEDGLPHKEASHTRFSGAEAGEQQQEEEGEGEGEEPLARNPFGRSNQKYWAQRYRLFSRYDEGIWLDRGMYM
jgi:hypothetical protein